MGSNVSTPQQTDEQRAVNAFVKKMLDDPQVNMALLPDSIEQKMYQRIVEQIIGSLHNLSETTKIEVLGHIITFQITPIS